MIRQPAVTMMVSPRGQPPAVLRLLLPDTAPRVLSHRRGGC